MKAAITNAWCRETSADPERWSEDNPAWGQCAVTALAVQDYCGGDLLRSTVNGISHYWNRMPEGAEVDLTLQQFGDAIPDAEPVVRERDYVLSFVETAQRYELLKRRIAEAWSAATSPQGTTPEEGEAHE